MDRHGIVTLIIHNYVTVKYSGKVASLGERIIHNNTFISMKALKSFHNFSNNLNIILWAINKARLYS